MSAFIGKPTCLTCCAELRVRKVGSAIIEWAFEPEAPYLVRWVDELECPVCHSVTSYGSGNPTYHHQSGFEKELELARSDKDHCFEVHEARNRPAIDNNAPCRLCGQ